jgi:hypothetical protein
MDPRVGRTGNLLTGCMDVVVGCVVCAAAMLACVGCGSRDGVVPVTGIARLQDGTPLPGGRVFLTGGTKGANGQIKPDGTFVLGTATMSDGAMPGTYTVFVVGAAEPDTRSYDDKAMGIGKAPPSLIAKKYDTAATSDLRAEIKPPKTHLELVLDPSDAAVKTP